MNTATIPSSALNDISESFGTPFFAYSSSGISSTIQEIQASEMPSNLKIYYSVLANSNPEILKVVRSAGIGFHLNSANEFRLTDIAGISSDEIVVTGSNYTSIEIETFVRRKVEVYLDSLAQLSQYLDLGGQDPGVRVHLKGRSRNHRMGLCVSELNEARRLCESRGRQLVGLHFYRGTGTNSVGLYRCALTELFDIAKKIPTIRTLNLGGGQGYKYSDAEGTPSMDWSEYFRLISNLYQQFHAETNRSLTLVIEPGRSIVASSGVYICKVIDVKRREGVCYLGTNGSVANLGVLTVHGKRRRVSLIGSDGNSLVGEGTESFICGCSTFGMDFLARNIILPVGRSGDLVRIDDSGAYGYAMTNNFLGQTRPPEFLLEGDLCRQIRARESSENLTALLVNLPVTTIRHEKTG